MKKRILLFVLAAAIVMPMVSLGQGCMEPASDEGVSVIGYIQPQFNFDFNGYDKNTQHIGEYSSFLFKRARLGVTGNIPYDFSYYVMAEFSPFLFSQGDAKNNTGNGPYLLDAFVTYKRFGPALNITLGQFKAPFGLELSTPCQGLHAINRSLAVRELVAPFRDMGIMFWGGTDSLSIFGLKNHNIIAYQLAITNGVGINRWDDNASKDFIGRIVLSPWKFISLGASYKYGVHAVRDPNTDNIVKKYGQKITRIGFDGELEFGDFLLQGEYIWGYDDGYTSVGGGGGGCGSTGGTLVPGNNEKYGYFAQAMYMTPWRIQPIVKYENFEPNIDVDEDNITTYTFGFNYFFNDWTRLQVNYLINDYQAKQTQEYYLNQLLVQVQVKF